MVYGCGMVSTTTTTIAPTNRTMGDLASHEDLRELVLRWLAGKSPRTVAAYRADLHAFASHLGAEDPLEAVKTLLGSGPIKAMGMASAWFTVMEAGGLAPSTINRRMSTLRSLSALVQVVTGWTLQTPSARTVKYRDTRGPDRESVQRLIHHTRNQGNPLKASRDLAVVALLLHLGLRRGEVVSLDRKDVDLEAGVVRVVGKGRTEAETITLPTPTAEVLVAWLAHRGDAPGPLITNVDRRTQGTRLTANGLHHLITTLGKKAGVKVRPHGLRHSAITMALDLTGGDVRQVQRFSRHRDIKTVMAYDDTRRDLGGAVASLVATDTMSATSTKETMGA